MANKWSDPQTVLALVRLGTDLTPRIIALFKKPANPQLIEPYTLEELIALGYSIDEANQMLIAAANAQP